MIFLNCPSSGGPSSLSFFAFALGITATTGGAAGAAAVGAACARAFSLPFSIATLYLFLYVASALTFISKSATSALALRPLVIF